MIFSELYSAYYNTVAAILTAIMDGERSERALGAIVAEYAFGESALTILPALKEGKWQLVHPDMTTPLVHKPTMPLTNLQKSWLKAISLDPRVRLFGVDWDWLGETEPLFTPEDYDIYDRYGDGDPYGDAAYAERFRFLLTAVREKTPLVICMVSRRGKRVYFKCVPERMEYSPKDDKFRLITRGCRFMPTVNLASIVSCKRYDGERDVGSASCEPQYDELTLKVTDERNALERIMLHFAHFEKRAERMDDRHYLVRIRYAREDANEMAIRVLSFGPMAEALGPADFRNLIVEKLKKQKSCGLL